MDLLYFVHENFENHYIEWGCPRSNLGQPFLWSKFTKYIRHDRIPL